MIGRTSLTLRLTLLFAAGSAIVLGLLGTLIGYEIERHFISADRAVLEGKIELARQLIERIDSPAKLDQLPGQLEDALVGHHDLVTQVIGPHGERLLTTSTAEFPGLTTAEFPTPTEATRMDTWSHGDQHYRGLQVALATAIPDTPPLRVGIAIDLIHHETFLASFNRSLWLFVLAAAALSGVIGWLAARRGLKPLAMMRETARAVTAQHLDRRLPIGSVPSELADLAASLNEMLARLEDAFQRLSDFSSDLAHELRTPVSNLITETQVALSRPRDEASYRLTLESNAEELDRLSRMIADMLLLAKAEHGLMLPRPEIVDLGRELNDLLEFYEPLASSRGLAVRLDGEGQLAGDRLMLRRAFGNLISNAVHYTPCNSAIRIGLNAGSSELQVLIENTGDTIPPEHLPFLFDRFYRADAARRHVGVEGSGLGLAITRAIIDAHAGSIGVTSSDGVTRFEVTLPRGATGQRGLSS